MKKYLHLILLIILITLTGCIASDDEDDDVINEFNNFITIYSLNDFHGAVFLEGREGGISRIGHFLMREKRRNPSSTVIVSAGDMFQGTAISSLTRGQIVVDAMNMIGFDAMTIGNHEFDWGIEGITRFLDGDETKANFPFLGANIYQKSTDKLADFAEPYTIIQRGPVKIGIIGTIGEDLTNSILASIVEDYEFTNQLTAIKKYTKILRTEEECDIVIVSSHADTSSINYQLADLDGEYKVDAIINGHTHRAYAGEIQGTRDVPLPYVQALNNGAYIAKITLEIDPFTRQVINVSAENIETIIHCKVDSLEINELINSYNDVIEVANEILGISGQRLTRVDGAIWAANTIRKHSEADVGIVNYGGIRASGFPIDNNSNVTFGNVFKIMPFENKVIKVHLTGEQLKFIISNNIDSLYFSSNLNINSQTISGVTIDDQELYLVATVDFVFEKKYYNFHLGENIVNTNTLFRDYLVEEVKSSSTRNGKWITDDAK